MDINRCFEILELDRGASVEEAKQAYKDIANVWHPDRFSHNPRLREKAEKKLKEINAAYATVKSFLSQKGEAKWESGADTKSQTQADGAHTAKPKATTGAQDRTERVFEVGTRMFLEACSFLYTTLRQAVDKQSLNTKGESKVQAEGPKQQQHRSGSGEKER
jgi:curved DNA-binding protein CbpA